METTKMSTHAGRIIAMLRIVLGDDGGTIDRDRLDDWAALLPEDEADAVALLDAAVMLLAVTISNPKLGGAKAVLAGMTRRNLAAQAEDAA